MTNRAVLVAGSAVIDFNIAVDTNSQSHEVSTRAMQAFSALLVALLTLR